MPGGNPAVRFGFGECQLDPGSAEPIDALMSAALFCECFGDVRVGAPPRRVLPPPRRKPLTDRPAPRTAAAAMLDLAVMFAPGTSLTSSLLLTSSVDR
jgi:hypothetical protein